MYIISHFLLSCINQIIFNSVCCFEESQEQHFNVILLFRNTTLQGTHVKPQRGHGNQSTTLQNMKELLMKTNSVFQHTARFFMTRKHFEFYKRFPNCFIFTIFGFSFKWHYGNFKLLITCIFHVLQNTLQSSNFSFASSQNSPNIINSDKYITRQIYTSTAEIHSLLYGPSHFRFHLNWIKKHLEQKCSSQPHALEVLHYKRKNTRLFSNGIIAWTTQRIPPLLHMQQRILISKPQAM